MSQNDPPPVVPVVPAVPVDVSAHGEPPPDLRPRRPLLPPAPLPMPWREFVRRFIVDYNPFFLLSALCMLLGCLVLTNSLSWSPVRLQRILLLAATINAYELILVGLGVFLIRKRQARRDGAILLILEAFFLVDVAFLNAELFAIDRWVGLWANLLIFVLAIGKLTLILRAIGGTLGSLPVLAIVAQLVVLFALPGVLKFYASSRGGLLPPLAMLGAWWTLFAVGAAATFIHAHARRAQATPLAPWFAPLLTVVSFVSLVAHVGTSQWIYDLRYWGADLAPMLALASLILCLRPAWRGPGVMCAIAAVMASTSHNHTLRVQLLGQVVSPVHVTLGVVYLLLAWTLARAIFVWLASLGVAAGVIVVFGPTLAQIRAAMAVVIGWIDLLRPKTQQAWGICAVVASFLFLAIGAAISLRRGEQNEHV